jgi:hypothetical protein
MPIPGWPPCVIAAAARCEAFAAHAVPDNGGQVRGAAPPAAQDDLNADLLTR